MDELQRIERRDIRRQRRMNEIERIEAIDQLADRFLDQAEYDGVPATEVWDAAAEEVDRREDERRNRHLIAAARGMGDLPIGSYDHGHDDAAADAAEEATR